jgi:hypothetical protein
MQLADIVAIAVILLIVGAATAYIIKAKKSGKKCIGCPDSSSCSGSHACSGSCSSCRGCAGKNDAERGG